MAGSDMSGCGSAYSRPDSESSDARRPNAPTPRLASGSRTAFIGIPWLLAVLIPAVYVAILATGDIQEDAMITFRTAFNLADHGELSFNLGERYSSATSMLYPFLVSLARLALGPNAIAGVLVINSLAVIGAAALAARVAHRGFRLPPASTPLVWAALALSPISLLMAVKGMEAPYVVLLTAMSTVGILNRKEILAITPMALLVFIRPDAIAFNVLLLLYAFTRARRMGWLSLAASAAAWVLYVALNLWLFGTALPRSVLAKYTAYNVGHISLADRMGDLLGVFRSEMFSPFAIRFLEPAYAAFTIFAIFFTLAVLTGAWRAGRSHFTLATFVVAAVWAPPLAYLWGGSVMFGWYLWPSQFAYQSLVVAAVFFVVKRVKRRGLRRLLTAGAAMALAGLVGLQWMLSLSHGLTGNSYMTAVGTYIAAVSEPGDTLLLEPAGYIPFHAQLRTIDEIGLASPVALRYVTANPSDWWFDLVHSETPTFIVSARPFEDFETGHREWLLNHYSLGRHFRYLASDWAPDWFLPIAALGTNYDYYVYRRSP